MTTNEIGRLVGVSERTVANWIDRNYLAAFRTPGGHRRVDPRVLAEFLTKRGMPVPEKLIERVSILIVEDDVQVGETMRNWLVQAGEGFDVRLVNGGVEALLTIGAQKPKLVLLDVMMPGMDGVEVCKKIKADPSFSDIDVLFVTGRHDLDAENLRSATGASGVLMKPLKRGDLCRKVSSILGRDMAAVTND
jgi:excisionase family DNA binding protein